MKQFLIAAAVIAGLAVWAAGTNPAYSQRLVIDLPQGWVLGHQDEKGKIKLFEYVPEGQTVTNWTDMFSVMIYSRGRPLAQAKSSFDPLGEAANFVTSRKEVLSEICEEAGVDDVNLQFGNPFILTMTAHCKKGKVTGKDEVMLYRVIFIEKGSFFILRSWAKSRVPSNVMSEWQVRLGAYHVCDPGKPGTDCPESPFFLE